MILEALGRWLGWAFVGIASLVTLPFALGGMEMWRNAAAFTFGLIAGPWFAPWWLDHMGIKNLGDPSK